MPRIKEIDKVFNMRVYTEDGDYFGDVDEAILFKNRVNGWRVKATKNSLLSKIIGGAKGVIVPQTMVKAIGDVMIVSRAAAPSLGEEE